MDMGDAGGNHLWQTPVTIKFIYFCCNQNTRFSSENLINQLNDFKYKLH